MKLIYACVVTLVAVTATPTALAETVTVTLQGVVEDNQIGTGDLGGADVDDPVTLTFRVDSDGFTNSASFPTRGYDIDMPSFAMALGGAVVNLQSPFPAGQTPYFTLRDNDPAVDGFFVATSVDFPIGVPLDEVGSLGNFIGNFSVAYRGTTISSLDILDAVGSYDFTGLSVFNWTVDDGPFNPMLITFQSMTITRGSAPVPTLPEWGLIALTVLMGAAGARALSRN
ncbi:MAG: hypothetical protein ACI8Y8_003941 [Planctomycetota bacterium]|jgi:hypothetical protein